MFALREILQLGHLLYPSNHLVNSFNNPETGFNETPLNKTAFTEKIKLVSFFVVSGRHSQIRLRVKVAQVVKGQGQLMKMAVIFRGHLT